MQRWGMERGDRQREGEYRMASNVFVGATESSCETHSELASELLQTQSWGPITLG